MALTEPREPDRASPAPATQFGGQHPQATQKVHAKTGTTDDAQSAFFIGAIPQYALTVGIFTDSQSDKSPEAQPGGNVGGGFGGYWLAGSRNTFAENEFASLGIRGFPLCRSSAGRHGTCSARAPPALPGPTQAPAEDPASAS